MASEKKLQIIFTTHAQSILSLDYISVRHLHQTPSKTLCFSQTKPDALQRLTGKQTRTLEVFVEDDLAFSLIKKIASQTGISKHIGIIKFGAAVNCFTSVSGAILNNLDNQENMLFVLDGDIYTSYEEKTERINAALTGNTEENKLQRSSALSRITEFIIPKGTSPEKYYHGLICKIDDAILNEEQLEIVKEARQIINPIDTHDYFNKIIKTMDFTREVGLNKLIDILSLSDEWSHIKQNIQNWFDQKRSTLIEE